jgi:DNA-binding transcriptional ArsR family regulator
MRPLYHPPMSAVTVEGILFALSDPVRFRLFAELVHCEGRNCAAFVNVGDIPLPKSTLSQQFRVLRESGLIRSERNGVELRNYTRCDELKRKYGRLIQTILQAYRSEEQGSNP